MYNSQWKETIKKEGVGFIPATNGLDDLEIMVIVLVNYDKKYNIYGFDIVKEYWSNWFETMGVKRYEIYGAELPSNIEQAIKRFILK